MFKISVYPTFEKLYFDLSFMCPVTDGVMWGDLAYSPLPILLQKEAEELCYVQGFYVMFKVYIYPTFE